MTPAYAIAQITVNDLNTYVTEYGLPVLTMVQEAGGQILAASPDAEVTEGDWAGNWTVIISFPDEAKLRAWYESEAYAPLKAKRVGELTSGNNVVLVPGLQQ